MNKGCEYCKGRAYTKKPLTVITKYGRKIELVFEFCPNCGRKMASERNIQRIAMDEQIEEMAKDIEVISNGNYIDFYKTAKILVDKGYREASDLAKDIFEDIDSISVELHHILPSYVSKDMYVTSKTLYDELKKKYIKQSEG